MLYKLLDLLSVPSHDPLAPVRAVTSGRGGKTDLEDPRAEVRLENEIGSHILRRDYGRSLVNLGHGKT